MADPARTPLILKLSALFRARGHGFPGERFMEKTAAGGRRHTCSPRPREALADAPLVFFDRNATWAA